MAILFKSYVTRFLTGVMAVAITLTMGAHAVGSSESVASNSISANANVAGVSSLMTRIAGTLIDFLIPSAEAVDVTVSSSAPLLSFDDTDVGDTLDWFWLGNGGSGTTGNMRLTDANEGADTIPIYIFSGENNNYSLRVDGLGDVGLADSSVFIDRSLNRMGIGTTIPTEELHIAASSPAIRLDSGGVDYRMVNSADDFTFNIQTNAGGPTGAVLTIENDLNLISVPKSYPGLGVWQSNPEVPLHVGSHDGRSAGLRVQNAIAPIVAGDITMFELRNTGNKIVRFKVNAGGGNFLWTFDNDPNYNGAAGINSGRFRIAKSGTGVAEFTVDGFGNGTFLNNSFAVNHVNTSSREFKTGFKALNQREVLDKLASLPVTEWQYKQDGSRHYGPVAEEFQETFGLGDGKHISTVDTAGVTMAAIQGMYDVVKGKDAEIKVLKEDSKILKEDNKALEEQSAIALAAVKALTEKSAELSTENDELKLRMQVLEAKMADLIQVMSMKEASLNTMAAVK